MEHYTQWTAQAREFALRTMEETFAPVYHFHNAAHVEQVVRALHLLAETAGLEARDHTVLILAGWFHDLGYADGPQGHEERGAELARVKLAEWGAPADLADAVAACILATRMPHRPSGRLEELMADADLSHLGMPEYWSFISRLRQELREAAGRSMDEAEWLDFEIAFLAGHSYHSPEARILFDRSKARHLKKLRRMRELYEPGGAQAQASKKAEEDEDKRGRGVETMFRSAYRTHINLSSIADNKANIMLSVNAIIISIAAGTLLPRTAEHAALLLPSILLLLVCLTAMVFATLATMPKVTEGRVTRESIQRKEANLIFFGNFYRMSLADYQWGMGQLIGDERFIYDTMTRDLYFLGIVLAKKYALLRRCYLVFMWGLILTVAAFALAILAPEQVAP